MEHHLVLHLWRSKVGSKVVIALRRVVKQAPVSLLPCRVKFGRGTRPGPAACLSGSPRRRRRRRAAATRTSSRMNGPGRTVARPVSATARRGQAGCARRVDEQLQHVCACLGDKPTMRMPPSKTARLRPASRRARPLALDLLRTFQYSRWHYYYSCCGYVNENATYVGTE